MRDSTGFVYLISFALMGVGYSLTQTINQFVLVGRAPSGKLGTAAGIFESSVGGGGLIGPILAGLLTVGSIVNAFYLPLVVLFVMTIMILFRHRKIAEGTGF